MQNRTNRTMIPTINSTKQQRTRTETGHCQKAIDCSIILNVPYTANFENWLAVHVQAKKPSLSHSLA